MNHAADEITGAAHLHPKVFVLRLWAEPQSTGTGCWRASINHPDSGQRWYFSRPTELAQFLLEAGPEFSLPDESIF